MKVAPSLRDLTMRKIVYIEKGIHVKLPLEWLPLTLQHEFEELSKHACDCCGVLFDDGSYFSEGKNEWIMDNWICLKCAITYDSEEETDSEEEAY